MPERRLTVLIPVQETSSADLNTCLFHLFENFTKPSDVYVVQSAISEEDSVRNTCQKWTRRLRLTYIQYQDAASALELCRWAYESIPLKFSDILILHPGVFAGPYVVQELTAVLEVYERHSLVIPRSNRRGIAAVPVTGPELSPAQARHVWTSIKDSLPRYQTIPYIDTSCMLIRRETLQHFGLFASDSSEQAYSERINRYGYSTVLANHAFVDVPPGLPPSVSSEELRSYFEFDVDPADYFAELSIPHRPRMLVDLFHLAPRYYGTADFALNLLRELRQLTDHIDFYIDIQPASFEFFLPELHGYRLYSENLGPQLFDLAFKPTHINAWEELERVNRLAPRVAYTILDMIAVRCNYLSAPGREVLFRTAAELCDRVFTLSHSAGKDFSTLTGSELKLDVIHLGTNFGVSTHEFLEGTYVLLMGNAYSHKGIQEALNALKGEAIPIVVLGGSPPEAESASNIRYLESGEINRTMIRATLAGARIVIYPSHYEGFGLPVLDALALKKQVIVLDNETNQEMERLAGAECLQRVSTARDLKEAIRNALNREPASCTAPRHWHSTAQEYLTAFRNVLDADIDCERLRARWSFLRAWRA